MYVHGVERMIHRNVNPASILINQSGRWKLACFGFAEKTQDGRVTIHFAFKHIYQNWS